MSNLTITTTATAGIAPEGIKPALLTNVIKAFTESDSVHVRRTRAIGALVAAGVSARGIVPLVTGYTGGATPSGFSKSSVSRYAQVAAAITSDNLATLAESADAADVASMVADLYRIAGPGGSAAHVARAAELAGKCETFTDAMVAVAGVKGEVNGTAAREAAGEVESNRPVGGEAADGGRAIEAADADESDASPAARETVAEVAFGALTVTRMLAIVRERIATAGHADAAIVEAVETLAAEVNAYAGEAVEV